MGLSQWSNGETALIVAVPEAEPVVGTHRARLDENAALGIPAHVTILAPFLPGERLGAAELVRLTRLFAAAAPFDVRLDHSDWFGTSVLWLGPEDPAPFRDLTARVFAAFPDYPPYKGQFDAVIPHLTVGYESPVEQMRSAEEEIAGRLPIVARVTAVTLLTESSPGGRWDAAVSLPLGLGEAIPTP